MTFEDVVSAMKADAKICNERARAIFKPMEERVPQNCSICGKVYTPGPGYIRIACSDECSKVSKRQKTQAALTKVLPRPR